MVDINLGCGTILLPGVVNIDIVKPYDVQADITRRIPFNDNEVRNATCYHVIEHLVYPYETNSFLAELIRVMDGTGTLTITTPSAHDIIDQMATLPDGQRAQELRCLLFGTREHSGHHHEWLYTKESLHKLLYDYFRHVYVTENEDDHGGPGLQANCRNPRKGMMI